MTQEYTFRALKATDLFPIIKLIGKIGINEFAKCIQGDAVKALMGGAGGADAGTVGVRVALEAAEVILLNIGNCEKEIYSLLASVTEFTAAQIKDLDLATFGTMIIDFVRKEEFSDFFSRALRLAK